MRFRENTDAAEMFKEALGQGPGMRFWYAYAGDWQFVIAYDQLHGHWGASYQPRHPAGRTSSTPCDNPPSGQRVKFYESQNEAEKACVRKYRQLREDN